MKNKLQILGYKRKVLPRLDRQVKLNKEVKKCEELLELYKEIPAGFFGVTMIEQSLKKARLAKTDKEIEVAIKDLREIEG